MANPSTQAASSLGRSLTVTRKGQVTLRKELLAHLGIQPGQRIDELNDAAAAGPNP